jgi:DNA-binding beta-propeller fold protein YncE
MPFHYRRLATRALVASIAALGIAAGTASAAAPSAYVSLELVNGLDPNVGQFDLFGGGGALTAKATPAVTSGSGPDGLAAHPNGKYVYVSVVGVSPAEPAKIFQYGISPDGSLSPLSPAAVETGVGTRPDGIAISPDGRHLYAADNSVSGAVLQFDINTNGTLTAKSSVAAGGSPERVAITPNGQNLYAVNNGGSVSQYDIGPDGGLTAKAPATVTAGPAPRSIVISPDGQDVYVTNTGDGTISQYDVQPGGTLKGKIPATVITGGPLRGIAITPNGATVYATDFGFHIGPLPMGVHVLDVAVDGTLALKAPPDDFVTAGNAPVEVTVSLDGRSAYVSNYNSGDISQFDIAANGVLTPKSTPLVAAGSGPTVIALNPPEKPPAASCQKLEATITGSEGRDVLNGTDGDDVIVGLGGRDKISGGGGRDVICAGKGKDSANGGAGNDRIAGQDGTDKLKGGKGDDRLMGDGNPQGSNGGNPSKGARGDKLRGGAGTDHCIGGGRRDVATGCESVRGIP